MELEDKQKIRLNIFFSIINKIVTIACGMFLPRLFISTYGSQVNGLISSITYFLAFISILDMGIGAVVQSSLYEPLVKKDKAKINEIIKSSNNFFRKLSAIFIVYILVLMVVYPLFINSEYDWFFEDIMIIIMSINLFADYFVGITYSTLLSADLKAYIPAFLNIIGTLLNFVLCLVLINNNSPIYVVKLVSAIAFLIKPIFVYYYVKKNYSIDKNIILNHEPIKQKWNGVAQHVAYYVTSNTAAMAISFFSTLSSVSIYNVYGMIVEGMRDVIMVAQTGIESFLGNILVNKEEERIYRFFSLYEFINNFLCTFMFTCTLLLIIPFITIYTKNITDANYIQPLFAYVFILGQYMYCIGIPYNNSVLAAGHYKETQTSSIIESILNIIITIIFGYNFGLWGVVFGTFVAFSCKTVYLAFYTKNIITNYNKISFVKNIICNITIIVLSFLLTKNINLDSISYLSWFIMAAKVGIIVLLISIVINLIFNKNIIVELRRSVNTRK